MLRPYYLHSPRTASGARYIQEVRVYWYGRVEAEACSSGLLQHGLNFSTAWCTTRQISVEKDWKHVLMQNVVTPNTCCDGACPTFQLPLVFSEPPMTTSRAPTFERTQQTFSQMKKFCSAQVGVVTFSGVVQWWASGLQFVFFWDKINNQNYVWIILLKMTFGFSKVKWLHLIGDVDKSVTFHVKFSQDLTYQKS